MAYGGISKCVIASVLCIIFGITVESHHLDLLKDGSTTSTTPLLRNVNQVPDKNSHRSDQKKQSRPSPRMRSFRQWVQSEVNQEKVTQFGNRNRMNKVVQLTQQVDKQFQANSNPANANPQRSDQIRMRNIRKNGNFDQNRQGVLRNQLPQLRSDLKPQAVKSPQGNHINQVQNQAGQFSAGTSGSSSIQNLASIQELARSAMSRSNQQGNQSPLAGFNSLLSQQNPQINKINQPQLKSQQLQGSQSQIGQQASLSQMGQQGSQSQMGQQASLSQIGQQGIQSQMGQQASLSQMGQQGIQSQMRQKASQSQMGQQGIQSQMRQKASQSQMGQQGIQSQMGQQVRQPQMGQQDIQSKMGQKGIQSPMGQQGIQSQMGQKVRQPQMGQQGIRSQMGQQGGQPQMGQQGIQSQMGQQLSQSQMGQQGIQPQIGQQGIQSQIGQQGIQSQMGQQGIQSQMGQQFGQSQKGQQLGQSQMRQKFSQSRMGQQGSQSEMGQILSMLNQMKSKQALGQKSQTNQKLTSQLQNMLNNKQILPRNRFHLRNGKGNPIQRTPQFSFQNKRMDQSQILGLGQGQGQLQDQRQQISSTGNNMLNQNIGNIMQNILGRQNQIPNVRNSKNGLLNSGNQGNSNQGNADSAADGKGKKKGQTSAQIRVSIKRKTKITPPATPAVNYVIPNTANGQTMGMGIVPFGTSQMAVPYSNNQMNPTSTGNLGLGMNAVGTNPLDLTGNLMQSFNNKLPAVKLPTPDISSMLSGENSNFKPNMLLADALGDSIPLDIIRGLTTTGSGASLPGSNAIISSGSPGIASNIKVIDSSSVASSTNVGGTATGSASGLTSSQDKMSLTLHPSRPGARPIVIKSAGNVLVSQYKDANGQTQYVIKTQVKTTTVNPIVTEEAEVESEELTSTTPITTSALM